MAQPGEREIWRRTTTESGYRHAKLFVAITGQAVYGDAALSTAVAASMRQRTALAEGLVRNGCPEQRAQMLATSLLASLRGLFVDLLMTGDRERVDAAFEDVITGLERRRPESAS